MITRSKRTQLLATVAILVVTSLFSVVPAAAQTAILSGDVSGTWDIAGSPYLIEGDITVPAGQTLTIEPGVEVIFQSWYALTVNGTLLAQGTLNAPILFTTTDSSPGWLGIRFANAPDGSQLAHVIVERGKASGADPLNKGGGIFVLNSSPTIRDSTIRDNFAVRYGGGIYLSGSNALLSGNTIVNNTAGQGGSASGGGIFIDGGNPTLEGNTISGNRVYVAGSYTTPYGRGGGIFVSQSDPTLRYNVISNNQVDGQLNSFAQGGALFLSSSDPDLIHNTITGNTVGTASGGVYDVDEGGGLYLQGSNPVIVNTILWNDSPQEIFIADSYTAISLTVDHSDVQGGQAGIVDNGSATINWLQGNIDADPAFVDPANGNWQLAAGSPAIDAGTAYFAWQGRVLVDLAPTDYIGAAPDMGALESNAPGGGNPPPDELHVEDQTVTRVTRRRNARGQDVVLIADQNGQPVAGATVTAVYSGPNQGQVSGVTGADGRVVLNTPWVRKPKDTWCFEVTDVAKDGTQYNSAANVVTIQCESN